MVKNLPEIQETLYNSGDAVSITGSGRSPGEGNASSILAWKVPWTEESAELWSMGSQKVRHDGSTNAFTFIFKKENNEKKFKKKNPIIGVYVK